MEMRKPKALVIPFKFREGYEDKYVDPLIESAVRLMTEQAGLDIVKTEAVTFDRDADLVAGKYNAEDFDFAVYLLPTWFEPVTMVRAAKPFFGLPTIVWGFGNFMLDGKRTNLGSSAGAGVTKGTLREYGVKHMYLYYSPADGRDEVLLEKLYHFARAARAVRMLKRSRILTIGYQFGGMTLGDMDLTKMNRVFGVDLVEDDGYSLIQRLESIDTSGDYYRECEAKVSALTGGTIGGSLERVTRMYAALKEMVGETRADAVTMKCHFVFSQQYGLSACIPLSVIGNEMVASCEADIPLTLTELALHYLSGGELATYADTHDLTGERILFGACGFAPAGMCIGNRIICQLPPKDASGLGATFKEYITNRNFLKPGRMTAARILKDPDGGFTFHAAGGEAVGDIGEACEIGMPQYSFTEMIPDCDFDTFAQHTGSHHYALCYADLEKEIPLFCEFLGIRCLYEESKK